MTDERVFWNQVWSRSDIRPYWTQVDPEVRRLADETSRATHPRVLDIGCGLGRNAIAFAQSGFLVTAIDVSEDAIDFVQQRAQELDLKITTEQGRFTDDVFGSDEFDVVLAVNVLYHGYPKDFRRALHNIRKWLRPGGLLYFTCPSLDDGEYGRGKQVAPHTFELEPGHVHFNANWPTLQGLLSDFQVVRRKERHHEWELEGTHHSSCRWQVLAERLMDTD